MSGRQPLETVNEFSGVILRGQPVLSPGVERHPVPGGGSRAIQIQKNDEGLRITLTANAYLQRMVRNIVGALVQIGKQEKDAKWMHDVLKGRDRKLAGIAAPAHGLTLLAVKYPSEFDIDFI